MPRELSLMASEARAALEFRELRLDPVYRGIGMPRGDGRQVLVLPGLLGNDLYLTPIRAWLRRIGYTPRVSALRINAGCPERLMREVERTFRAQDGGDGVVAIIGHSRGGMLGKALAALFGDRCSHFIALGSPVGAITRTGREGLAAMTGGSAATMADPEVVAAGRRAMHLLDPDCDMPACGCSYVDNLCAPFDPATRIYAIYSVDDRVLKPSSCQIEGAENVEVRGSHSGLVFSRQTYPHIARALAA